MHVCQTGRKIENRFLIHCKSFRPNKFHSVIVQHCLKTGHSLSEIKDLKVLHVCNKRVKLNVLELIVTIVKK